MDRRFFVTFVLFVVLALGNSGCETERFFFEDESGRQMILHGLNISNNAKRDPLGVGWHTEPDYARMKEWGFNTVRLLVFWSSIEPEEGVFDSAYLDRVEERVGWAAQNGLHVILDMHQDVYGKKFGGDGAPVWATRDDGHPFERVSPWWLNYIATAVRAAFNHLWNDADLQQHYFDSWKQFAARFASNPTVIGYELMNEPFFGDINLFTFEEEKLFPFYQQARDAIRSVDPDAVIFFEPMIITSTGFPSYLPPINDSRTAYAPHFYQSDVHEGLPYDGNDTVIRNAQIRRAQEAAKHGVPWLMGEFGVAETTENFDLYLNDLLKVLDETASGWTCWSYDKGGGFSILDSSGNEKANLLPLIRPYPQKVAGEIQAFSFNPDTRIFELTYKEKAGVPGPTEIQVPASRIYGGNFTVTSTDPPGTWSYQFDTSREVLLLQADPQSSSHTVRIEP